MIFAAICLPHALYVASTGGDHFEYRPLDLYFPFAYLLMAAGVVELCRSRTAARLMFVYTAIVLVGIVEIPYRSHVEFPAEYSHGFPGKRALKVGGDRFLDPARSWVYRLPGLRAIAAGHQALLRESTRHFVGVRQEEHRLFLDRVLKEGKRLRTLVAEGVLPADTHVAVCCVGAIPYFSDLRTLDRFGLTDRVVARGEFLRPDMIAHGKYAGFDYAVEQGVDLWAIDPVHLLHDARNPHFLLSVSNAHLSDWDAYFAEVDEDLYLLVGLPGGFGAARARFPRLAFHSTRDGAAVKRLAISLGATVVETRDEKSD